MQVAKSTANFVPSIGAPVSFSGAVRRVFFRNDESGHSVIKVEPFDLALGTDVIVVGATLADEGQEVTVKGTWTRHAKYGEQVKAESIIALRPTSPDAIQLYLASGVLPGIGEGMAKRIVAKFGAETINILDSDPERLLEVSGIGERKIDGIMEAWGEQKASQQILMFLAGQGISPALAIRIYKTYGNKAIEVIRSNPYKLAENVRGIGFQTADKIAMSMGVPPNSLQRIEAGLQHVVREGTSRGHCGLPTDSVVDTTSEMLSLPEGAISPVLQNMFDRGDKRLTEQVLPIDLPCVFSRRLFTGEDKIAEKMQWLARLPGTWKAEDGEVAKLVEQVEEASGMQLANAQRAAVMQALTRRVSILTGGPGTGKTSTLKVVLSALLARRLNVVLAAPTGKAAKRMREATGHDAKTVARLIGMGADEVPPIDCDVLIIDEASMVDVPMMQAVLEQLVPDASLVLVGDVDQLPSVGPGRVLADLIESGVVPVTRLTEVFRQAAQSAIIRNSHRINRGIGIEKETPPDAPAPDFHFIESDDPAKMVGLIVRMVTQHIPSRIGIAAGDVQVLSPMRKSETGVQNLNAVLQEAVNPDPQEKIVRNMIRFGVGDRVLQTVNNYDLGVMNGEAGIIRSISKEDGNVSVEIDGREVGYKVSDLDQLTLAYAMTIHKSQGSQFPAVVMPVSSQHYMMLQRAILYTGITRASKFCVLIGQRKALEMAIRNDRMEPRLTRLRLLLQDKL